MKFPLIKKNLHFNKILFYIFYERKDSAQVNNYKKFKVIRIVVVKIGELKLQFHHDSVTQLQTHLAQLG